MFERGDYISFANCGLPYHVSGRIRERDSLLLQTPEGFWSRFRVEVRLGNEVLDIDTRHKRLQVRNLKTGEEYAESYDTLILSPGAYPFVPPIEGSGAAMFMTLRDIPDMDAMIARIENQSVTEAVVIGGGFIGVEIAENLIARGIKTHLVEMLGQVMMPFDPEMASIIEAGLTGGGVCLHLSDSVKRIVVDGRGKVILDSGTELTADLVVSAIGVRPDVELARKAGLRIGVTGGIAVDAGMRTSDPCIFAAGDAVRARELAANDFKYWELMRRSSERGLKVFDYGRSKIGSGSYSFKKNWGFVPHPLNYEYRLYKRDAIPQNNPNNPKYQLMIAAWRRLPLWVANRLGPLIVRNLG